MWKFSYPIANADKVIDIYGKYLGENITIFVDYDDVNHPVVAEFTEKLLLSLNSNKIN